MESRILPQIREGEDSIPEQKMGALVMERHKKLQPLCRIVASERD
jgi:hypothetical protein